MIPLPQGGLTRRPGTRFVAAAASHDQRPRLLPFEFSTEQAYVLEAGEGSFRFFRNKGLLTLPPTDAAIVNGGFDVSLSGWNDLSSGSATAGHAILNAGGVDTLKFAQLVQRAWGAAVANRRHIALQWTAPESGDVAKASIVVVAHSSDVTAVAAIYSDSDGSPGAQIGGDSAPVTVGATGTFSFTWTAKPAVSAGSSYWVVFSDTGSGQVSVSLCADQGADFASGSADSIAASTNTNVFSCATS